MREKLATLPLAELRELAKAQGIKGVAGLRKSELIDRLCEIAQEKPEETGRSAAAEGGQAAETRSAVEPRVGAESRAGAESRGGAEARGRADFRRNGESRDASSENGAGETRRTYDSHDGEHSQSDPKSDLKELDSGIEANGILEVMPDGFGFIRCENFLPGENDVYVAPSQIRRFNMKTGDIVRGSRRVKTATEKFAALLYVSSINGLPVNVAERRPNFENLTPIFPNQRLHMETPGRKNSVAMRVLDLLAPIGKGQRGMIVSPPKAGKTTLLKQVAQAITTNHPEKIGRAHV